MIDNEVVMWKLIFRVNQDEQQLISSVPVVGGMPCDAAYGFNDLFTEDSDELCEAIELLWSKDQHCFNIGDMAFFTCMSTESI